MHGVRHVIVVGLEGVAAHREVLGLEGL